MGQMGKIPNAPQTFDLGQLGKIQNPHQNRIPRQQSHPYARPQGTV